MGIGADIEGAVTLRPHTAWALHLPKILSPWMGCRLASLARLALARLSLASHESNLDSPVNPGMK